VRPHLSVSLLPSSFFVITTTHNQHCQYRLSVLMKLSFKMSRVKLKFDYIVEMLNAKNRYSPLRLSLSASPPLSPNRVLQVFFMNT
jgi:hypothetical protein